MKLLLLVLGVLGLAHAQQCGPAQFTCDNGNCISNSWVCDGDNDCNDWSDEVDCADCRGMECNRRCIPDRRICDGNEDCDDGSDEMNCPTTTTTPCPGFTCPNSGRCIPASYICDGDDDCGDGSDERWEPGMPGYQCPGTDLCIPERKICDGTDDCADGSDEIWVPGMPGFACPGTGRCITESRKCDGNDDCGDGSDESEEECPCADDTDYRCAKPPGSNVPGPCIPHEWVCDDDNIWDCPDGSDEANCTIAMKKARTHPKVAHLHNRVRSSSSRQNSLRTLMKLAHENSKAEVERRQRKAEALFAFNHYRPKKEKKMKF